MATTPSSEDVGTLEVEGASLEEWSTSAKEAMRRRLQAKEENERRTMRMTKDMEMEMGMDMAMCITVLVTAMKYPLWRDIFHWAWIVMIMIL